MQWLVTPRGRFVVKQGPLLQMELEKDIERIAASL